MQLLLVKSDDYLAAHQAALLSNNNMPASFPAKYSSDANECLLCYKTLYTVQNTKSVSVSEKNNANNAVHAQLIDMFTDGQCIFANNQKVRKEFIFRQALRAVRGAGIAGLRGHLTNVVTGLPVADAIISTADGKYTATTDSKGHYHIKQILAGTYTFGIAKAGFQTVYQPVTIQAGITRRGNFSITLQESLLKVA